MRIRNWGHLARISSALKAPCLTGRSLDHSASWFAVDMAGGAEECTASVERCRERLPLGVITPLLPFLDMISTVWTSNKQARDDNRDSTQMLNTFAWCGRRLSLHENFRFYYINNLIPSRLQDPYRHPSSHCQTRITPPPLSFRTSFSFHPFTLPNVRLPISSPRSCTSNGDKHTLNSPNEITRQYPSSTQSGHVPVVRVCLLKWPRFFVVDLYSNILHECRELWMTRLSRARNVSWDGGGSKTRARTSSSLPMGLLGARRRRQHHCSSSALLLSNSVGISGEAQDFCT